MPRDHRRVAGYAVAESPAGTEGQRPCSRAQWCASRTVTVTNGERVTEPALGPRAFCDHDATLIRDCAAGLPALYLKLQAETHQPAAAEASVHVPFGPSVPVRLDIDAAKRLTATTLAVWAARVRASARLAAPSPAPVLSPLAVKEAADTVAGHLNVLLALQPDYMTRNVPLRPGRHGQAASIGDDLVEEYGDAEIVRMGVDFMGVWVQRDGAAAGLEILHLHYWDRAVLRETPARPEELLGVECRACSLMTLRRADPPWHDGDPEYYSECAECGDLMAEDDYRMWCGQLAAYHRARLASMPVLGATPA